MSGFFTNVRVMCVFAITAALPLLGCGTQEEGDVGVAIEPIVGGISAGAIYPEAAAIDAKATSTAWDACSGVIVAPRVVLTAGHCVADHSSWTVRVSGQQKTSTRSARFDWPDNAGRVVDPSHHDVGLVFLDSPISLSSYPAIARQPAAAGLKAYHVGRIHGGKLTTEAWGAEAAISDARAIGFPFDYTAKDLIEPGDSGGPVFQSGTHLLHAVASGAGGGIEVLARLDLVASWIDQQIAANGGAGPTDAGLPPPSPPTPKPPKGGGGPRY
jgi:hypothetical protein